MLVRRRCAGHGSLRKFTPTRAAFARPGPGAFPFPGFTARMQPSDSLALIGLGSGRPSPSAYLGANASSVPLSGPAARAFADALRVGEDLPDLRGSGLFRGRARASQVAGPSSSRVPWSKTPPGACSPRPWRRVRCCLQAIQCPGHPECHRFRGCMAHGPRARVPTHQRSRRRDRCKARYRSGRAHP